MSIEHDLTYEIGGFQKKFGQLASEAATNLIKGGNDEIRKNLIETLFKSLDDANRVSNDKNNIWTGEQVALLLNAIDLLLKSGKSFPEEQLKLLPGWIKEHPNGPVQVVSCLQILPPPGIKIKKDISGIGKQKKIFLANWSPYPGGQDRPIVLKIIGDGNSDSVDVKEILSHERVSHPLSTFHPNIIATHFLYNTQNQTFLVEKIINPLDDNWRAQGIDECANMLYHMAMALSYIHAHDLIHGDIKPDNIGIDHNNYILLDFGICRKEERYIDQHPTGSLRTRAPELLRLGKNSKASDVWALGASIFNSTSIGTFPLYRSTEQPPAGDEERADFASSMATLAENQWGQLVEQELEDKVPDPLRAVLLCMLEREPQKRPTAKSLVQMCEAELSAYIRFQSDNSTFSRSDEAQQIIQHLKARSESIEDWVQIISLMPRSQKRSWREVLNNPSFKPPPSDVPFIEALRSVLCKVDKI